MTVTNSTRCNLFIPFKAAAAELKLDHDGKLTLESLARYQQQQFDNYKVIERWANLIGPMICNCDCGSSDHGPCCTGTFTFGNYESLDGFNSVGVYLLTLDPGCEFASTPSGAGSGYLQIDVPGDYTFTIGDLVGFGDDLDLDTWVWHLPAGHSLSDDPTLHTVLGTGFSDTYVDPMERIWLSTSIIGDAEDPEAAENNSGTFTICVT